MKKIVFLDIDGVLNCSECFDRHRKEWEAAGKPTKHKWWNMLEPLHIEQLNRITDATGAEIVISSSWRGDPKTHSELLDTGVSGRIIGDTVHCCTRIRGAEIHKWLSENAKGFSSDGYEKGEYKVAILDDDSDMLLWQKEHFFQTNFAKGGLTEGIADAVIKHLNNPLPHA